MILSIGEAVVSDRRAQSWPRDDRARSIFARGLEEVERLSMNRQDDTGPESKKPRRHPLFGCMKGTIAIAPGVDLTEPASPEWPEIIEEKYSSLEAFLGDTKDEADRK